MSNHREHNQNAWDSLVRNSNRFARPARDEDFVDPLSRVDGPGWLGGCIRGQRVLCLAAGGGRQGPIYAAAGGIVTVVDISPAMLELDREVAAQRRLDLRTVQTSMEDLSMFSAGSFDLVIQPVSTCYVPDIRIVYRQVAKILQGNGLYISQHKQPVSLQATGESDLTLQETYYRHVSGDNQPLPAGTRQSLTREPGTREYLHRWEEILGELCRAGFVIEDLTEPMHAKADAEPGSFGYRSRFIAPYVRIKARRAGPATRSAILEV